MNQETIASVLAAMNCHHGEIASLATRFAAQASTLAVVGGTGGRQVERSGRKSHPMRGSSRIPDGFVVQVAVLVNMSPEESKICLVAKSTVDDRCAMQRNKPRMPASALHRAAGAVHTIWAGPI